MKNDHGILFNNPIREQMRLLQKHTILDYLDKKLQTS